MCWKNKAPYSITGKKSSGLTKINLQAKNCYAVSFAVNVMSKTKASQQISVGLQLKAGQITKTIYTAHCHAPCINVPVTIAMGDLLVDTCFAQSTPRLYLTLVSKHPVVAEDAVLSIMKL